MHACILIEYVLGFITTFKKSGPATQAFQGQNNIHARSISINILHQQNLSSIFFFAKNDFCWHYLNKICKLLKVSRCRKSKECAKNIRHPVSMYVHIYMHFLYTYIYMTYIYIHINICMYMHVYMHFFC